MQSPPKTSNGRAIGISAMGIAIPSLALPLTEFAKLRGMNAEQYTHSLGCQVMALCAPAENVISLAIKAAQRALQNWGKDLQQIGLLVVATETAPDMSRPLSSWVMEALGLKGNIRSYEVKHACYGGTAALRGAVEWHLSGNAKGKAALVIAADVALYAQQHSGEPTQGGGAVAMIIDTPDIASIAPISYYWSDPQYDFWRPVGNAYPEVNGRLSLSCYLNATIECFAQLAPKDELGKYLEEFTYVCMHVPFPKMVAKAAKKLGEYCGWDNATIATYYEQKIYSTMQWNQQIGNAYTASLWIAVANALTHLQSKQQFIAFSYGSGCGAELLTLQCTANQANSNWQQQLQEDLATRQIIDAKFYQTIRDKQ